MTIRPTKFIGAMFGTADRAMYVGVPVLFLVCSTVLLAQTVPSISIGRKPAPTAAAENASPPVEEAETALKRRQELFAAMKPLQVMLGSWNGTTQREVGDFKGLDKSEWVWDLKSNRKQPAMVVSSDASPYIRSARLTWLGGDEPFELQIVDAQGQARTLKGKFVTAPENFQGDDRQTHVKYKLELTQTDPPVQRDAWQLVFNQQENNRFLMEIAKRRGTRFVRVDTVAAQRSGTSFAKSDEGYGQRECIISGGLGTMAVTYQGATYWVCCTGCKAAFDEEPARWVAEFKKKKLTEAKM